MISDSLRLYMIIAIIIYFVLLILLIKKKSLSLKYSIMWLFAGVLMLILAIWPGILGWIASTVGILTPVNALFALMFFIQIIILVAITSIVTNLNEKVTRLTQNQALLEQRLRELENDQPT